MGILEVTVKVLLYVHYSISVIRFLLMSFALNFLNYDLVPVLRIRDILIGMRIRILGSVPL